MPIPSTDETTRPFPYLLVISRRDHIGRRKAGPCVDGGTPGIEKRSHVLFVHPARWDEGCIGKGAGKVLDVRRATQTGRKDLDGSHSRVNGVRTSDGVKAPRKIGTPALLQTPTSAGRPAGETTKVAPASIWHAQPAPESEPSPHRRAHRRSTRRP
jgi:hypothetical protein